eukprot:m.1205232 g.1205232  ORF g.1205232 m.1205232 type:complete len:251 (+) comp24582_c0_seq18:3670-4422(+)
MFFSPLCRLSCVRLTSPGSRPLMDHTPFSHTSSTTRNRPRPRVAMHACIYTHGFDCFHTLSSASDSCSTDGESHNRLYIRFHCILIPCVTTLSADGEKNRHVASTKMNSTSSRSHLLLQLLIEGHDTISGQMSKGKLTMVDLAGSERIAKTEATGQRLVEAASINKSLSALGQVFTALRQDQSHIPYRNSKLTHILQDSLGGDAKTCVFINTSPAESNLPETLSTLQFGSAISKIELKKDDKPKKKKTPR